ncbi:MAG: hypothetical protein ACLUEF_04345 [Faecalibacterium prausnitzii]
MKRKDVGTHWNRIQKPYEEHSIKKENLSRIFADRIFSICGVLSSFLKQCFMKSTCLNGQQPIIICVYGLHLLLSVFWKMYRAALITTAGNWTGILIGQVLGDFIIKINATKITPDMYIGKIWQLKAHYGVLIWLLVFLLSFIIGMLVEKKNHC